MSSRSLKKLTDSTELGEEPLGDGDDDWFHVQRPFMFSLVDLSDSKEDLDPVTNPVATYKQKNKTRKRKKKISNNSFVVVQHSVDALLDREILRNARKSRSLDDSQSPPEKNELFIINRKFQDYRAELQRKFGTSTTVYSVPNRDDNRGRNAFGPLVRPHLNWPSLIKCGLDMVYNENDNVFAFVHKKSYVQSQRAFYAIQATDDPNAFSLLLSKFPYHVDTLLQLSEYMMHQDNSKVAVDLLERALYALQSAFNFSFNFSTGNCRLDYRIQENRSLFIALFRYIFYIGSRSCYRAALEYCKLLLLLDATNDPLAILLAIDHFAIAAEDYDFILNLYSAWNPSRNLHLLPNFAFSIPLVHWLNCSRPRLKHLSTRKISSTEIDAMLQDALIMFPGFLPRLMKHTRIGGTDNLDKSILFGKEVLLSESESLGRLLDLYVARCNFYWKEPDVLAWLERCVEEVLQLVEPIVISADEIPIHSNQKPDPRLHEYSVKRKKLYTLAPRNVLRHIFLVGLPEVPTLLPPNFGSQKIYDLDPFPPSDSINTYNQKLEETPHGITGFLSTFFGSLWPSVQNNEVADVNNLLADLGLHMEAENLIPDAVPSTSIPEDYDGDFD